MAQGSVRKTLRCLRRPKVGAGDQSSLRASTMLSSCPQHNEGGVVSHSTDGLTETHREEWLAPGHTMTVIEWTLAKV